MTITKFTTKVALAATAAVTTLSVGAGLAQADPHGPPGPPWVPGGPGVNAGAPGNPQPPGQGYQPPPGHRADYDNVVPVWAPPAPPPPPWAPWLPVVWNADLPAWGVWWNGGFIQL
jgi:hypothetical protein